MNARDAELHPLEQAKLVAGIDLLRRTGSKSFQLRYSDDEQPVVWFAVALYDEGQWDAAAAPAPVRAVLRLCEQVVDGGRCTHCERPAGLEPDSIETMPGNELICWYQFDPENATFRRGCEGS